uniref:Chitin-binding type-2 domain-containing protein n=1 Tax=Anopheles atroparvus TaxID=41427 RepID=A0AAG5DAY2_ANOAO
MLQDLSHYLLTFVCVAWLAARADAELPEVSESSSVELVGGGGGDGGWQCQRPGRFSNPDDPSCRTYLTCIPESDPEPGLTQRLDECGPNALFSGRYQRCITGSDCETLEDFYAIEYECAECGKFVLPTSTDCRQFVNCLKTKDPGVFVPIRQSCPAGKLFSADAHGCVGEGTFECSPSTTTTTPATTTPSPVAAALPENRGGHLSDFVCLGPGRFPDESVPHCRGYRWCTATGDVGGGGGGEGQFVSRNFLCEPGQVFSEVEERCVPTESYQCPDDDDGGGAGGDGGVGGVGGAGRFRCAAVGRFPDRGSQGCVRYYHCQETAGGTLKALLERCPTGTVFSWLTTRCVPTAEYVCPVAALEGPTDDPEERVRAPKAEGRQQVEEPGEESSDVGATVSRQHRSRCSRSGRFANDEDALCRTYYICTRDTRGAWAKVLVRCPVGTIFSRVAARCVGTESVEPHDPCALGKKASVPIPAAVRSSEDTGIGLGSTEDLDCMESDLVLPNPADRTCRTYFRCRETVDVLDGGVRTPRLHLLACPEGTLFSTVAGRCVPVRAPADDERDDGSGQDFFRTRVDDEPLLPDYCTDVDPGSGELPDTLDPWPATAAPVVEHQPTTTMTSSTNQPSMARVRVRTPETTLGPPVADAGEAGRLGSYSGPAPEYPCTATGRFADINSVDCRSYFLCKQQQPSGSLVSVHLTCPDGTVFSRNLNKCIVSSRHVC